ncbi:enoyl-CoA hydratase/isomerase family protein [Sphingomonas sp. CGMCC 1.13654]|uniref:3-hydroxyisobutyryl-CoA hydrolase n=1 Tax=Sphingomonas chungangi TaxID=2683589 RepID=A0A838LBJ8_9SPHN|nr:enoyl-CoA hydratase/isomerase family protein [Sphingomonas chungangi]MVW55625.1 enoyl-CoA hydratase/isomerase family protein [Sphingomonas chungangi]
MTDEVLTQVDGKAGRLRLNRPRAIHALTQPMCIAMIAALQGWRGDEAVEVVLIDHAEGRGFCAGGDVVQLASDAVAARAFFHEEYRLNHLLFTYAKPVVAFMDGVTMGGGVGISQPAKYRIATENTLFAMPETGIGLFTDVGGGWYLSRLPGHFGEYLALTGARLDGAECVALGICTHYIPSEDLPALKAAIAADPQSVGRLLDEAAIEPPAAGILARAEEIERLFVADRYEDILAALAADKSEWAEAQLRTLGKKSPQTCKVCLRLVKDGRERTDFADEMRAEYGVAVHVIQRPDFAEGVRALLVDRDNKPVWNPATPDGVTDQMIDTIFSPLSDDEAWTPLGR